MLNRRILLAAPLAIPAFVGSYGWVSAIPSLGGLWSGVLIAVSLWLMVEAFGRLADPPEVQGGLVMALAAFALVIDLGTAWLTMRLAKESVNIRAAFLHNLADAAVSVAVLLGGALIWAFGWRIADPGVLEPGARISHAAVVLAASPQEVTVARSAREVHAMSLSNMAGEYATVASTKQLLATILQTT